MKERKAWIDWARVCAVVCVVLCHGTESLYGPVLRGEQQVGRLLWLAENTLFTIGRLGVPLFLAITGTLLLDRERDPGEFYRKSFLPLLATTELWIVLNYGFACMFQDVVFRWTDLLKEMVFLRTPELSHMWYMPMILGVYLALPFLSLAVRGVKNTKSFCLPYLVGCAAFLVVPTVNVFLTEAVAGGEPLKIKLELEYLGGLYGMYLLGGYLISRRRVLERVRTWLLMLAFAVSFLLNTAGQYYLYSHGFFKSTRLTWYSSLFLFVMGMTLFELLRRGFSCVHTSRVVELAARCSFGIYLLHKPIQILAARYLPLEELTEGAAIALLSAAGLGFSMLILLPFGLWWKRAGKWLFFIK